MVTPDLIREARLRAGLSQAELAARVRSPQSTIARWERGTRVPSLETTRRVIRACGLDLGLGLARYDDSYDALIDAQLSLRPRERLVRLTEGAEPLLESVRALVATPVTFVLIGPIAEILRGSPLATDANRIEACVASVPDDAEALVGVRFAERLAGSRGLSDLQRDATLVKADARLKVPVASLRDLVRIAEASLSDRSRTPALRATLERSAR